MAGEEGVLGLPGRGLGGEEQFWRGCAEQMSVWADADWVDEHDVPESVRREALLFGHACRARASALASRAEAVALALRKVEEDLLGVDQQWLRVARWGRRGWEALWPG